MAAHPVKMICVEKLLADQDRGHLEQARDNSAPDRQENKREQTWFFRCEIREWRAVRSGIINDNYWTHNSNY